MLVRFASAADAVDVGQVAVYAAGEIKACTMCWCLFACIQYSCSDKLMWLKPDLMAVDRTYADAAQFLLLIYLPPTLHAKVMNETPTSHSQCSRHKMPPPPPPMK